MNLLPTETRPPRAPVVRTEEQWIALKEQEARAGVQRALLGLGDDLCVALSLSTAPGAHPILRDALSSAGELLSSEAGLGMIEGSIGLPPSPLSGLAGALRRIEALAALAPLARHGLEALRGDSDPRS